MESTVQNKISVSFNDSMSFLSAIALKDLSHKNLMEVNLHAFLQPSAGVQWIGCSPLYPHVHAHTHSCPSAAIHSVKPRRHKPHPRRRPTLLAEFALN